MGDGGTPVRLSTYTGRVDLEDGTSLVFNLPRRTADFVPSETAEALACRPSELPPSLRDYAISVGYLTELSDDEELAWFRAEVEAIESLNGPSVTVSVIPTNSCNLACSYCFQANTEMRSLPTRHLTMEAASRVVAALDGLITSRGVSRLELFGGEPLLPKTRGVVTYLIEEAAVRGLTTRATTNGVHLHLFEELIGANKLCDLQISLDGSQRFHDARRVSVTGAPTFDKVYENIKLAISKGAKVFIRPNIDSRNLDGLVELIDLLERDGILRHPQVDFDYVNTIPDPIAPDAGTSHSITREETDAHLRRSGIDVDDLFSNSGLANLLGNAMRQPKVYACGAPTQNVYFSPEGQVYNCHELVGRPELSVGILEGSKLRFLPIIQDWNNRRIDKLINCRRCPLSYLHGGGCGARLSPDELSWLGNCDGYQEEFVDQVRALYRATSAT